MLSFAGDQFAQVAIAILVHRQTHSAFLTALAYALTYLPPIAGGPLLSGLADLFLRRQVMMACDVLRIGTVGLMAIPGMPFPALCALLFCTVLAGAPFSSARAALLPDVLPGDMFVLGSRSATSASRRARSWGSWRARRSSPWLTRTGHWAWTPFRSEYPLLLSRPE